ncbi:transcriptional regulator, partial [Streptomyces sp. NPDC059627]
PATDQVEGYPQHLHPADCTPPTPTPPDTPHPQTPAPAAPPHGHRQTPAPAAPPHGHRQAPARPRTPPHRGRTHDLIARAVHEALAAHDGDLGAATAELQRRAIPDAMALLDACRTGARYDIVGHPPLPGILRKKSAHGADEVWEARPHWTRIEAPPGTASEVTALDINGAYLSALKTHLPLGALEYSTGNVHSRRRSGIHLITPPEWDHHPYLPNPLGNREEPGPVWVTEPTLRLLQRLATEPYGPLCDPPVIHESFTSGSTEQLFEKFRQILRDAREKAITEDDEVTLEYVKSMYSKFVSTMGESNYNRELYRPDWMHIIRSQAFVNLWLKAHKAHTAGLAVMRVMGTDELHIAGDWRQVFTEGRDVAQVKVKDVYTLPTGRR